MEKKFLVVDFGDNDFYFALTGMGKNLLEEIGLEPLLALEEEGYLDDFLTDRFRACLALHQGRWDMYPKYYGYKEQKKDMERYKTGEYYQIKGAKMCEEAPVEWDNGETLIVDFVNEQVSMI